MEGKKWNHRGKEERKDGLMEVRRLGGGGGGEIKQ